MAGGSSPALFERARRPIWVLRWQLFLATAARGVYIARYRGEELGLGLVPALGESVTLAA